jgi:hypothetical protein
LAIFLMLLGASGTVAVVAASIVFLFYQYQLALHPIIDPLQQPARRGDNIRGVMGGLIPRPRVAEIEEKNAVAEKHIAAPLVLLEAPPAFAVQKGTDRAVDLNRHPSVAEYAISLHTWLEAKEQSSDGAIANLISRTLVELAESVQAVDPSEQASVRLRYRGFLADASRDGVSRIMPSAASADLSRASTFFLLNERGEPTAHRMDVSRVPVGADGAVKKVHETQRLLYEFFALPLPNAFGAKPGLEWNYQRVIPFEFSDEESTTRLFEATASLRGAQRNGSGEYAVIEIRGKIRDAEQAAAPEARGWALVDSASGIVMQAQIEVPFAFKLPGQMPRQITGTLHFIAQRQVPLIVEENN